MFKRLKCARNVFIIVCILCIVTSLAVILPNRVASSRIRATYVFEAPFNRPTFLVDEIALQMGKETLFQYGFQLDEWTPKAHDRNTIGPDGSRDKYVSRFAMSPNSGTVTFVNRNTHDVVLVNVEMTGSNIVCTIVLPK